MKLFLLAALAAMWLPSETRQWTARDQGQCRATGTYRNAYYGFQLRIPSGLRGCPNSPIGMTDHGVLIPISPSAGRVVEAYAGYNSALSADLEEAAAAHIESLRATRAEPASPAVVRRAPGRLGSLEAVRIVIVYKDKITGTDRVKDTTLALRSVNKSVEAPSHEYQVSLRTDQKNYERDRPVLENVLRTWREGATADDLP